LKTAKALRKTVSPHVMQTRKRANQRSRAVVSENTDSLNYADNMRPRPNATFRKHTPVKLWLCDSTVHVRMS